MTYSLNNTTAQKVMIELAKIRATNFLQFLLLAGSAVSSTDELVFKPHKTMQSG